MPSPKHLVLFDDECGFCTHWAEWILKRDKKNQIYFASLFGKTAEQYVEDVDASTLIFIEDFENRPKEYRKLKAISKILWHLGGWYKIMGLLSFLPIGLFNFIYHFIAKRRHKLYCEKKTLSNLDRFLP
jgi:predicted DCC family thiol-disulfide oxidoreductase YuxK